MRNRRYSPPLQYCPVRSRRSLYTRPLLDGSEWHITTTQAEHVQHEEFMTQSGHNMERWRELSEQDYQPCTPSSNKDFAGLDMSEEWTMEASQKTISMEKWKKGMSPAEVYGCALTRHEEHQIPTDRWEETALDHGSWKAESGWALKQNEEETSEKTTAKRSSST